jgi:hypothetical protein
LKIWLAYALIWPGPSSYGDPATADCIIVQAHGRNELYDREIHLVRQEFEARHGSDIETLKWLAEWKFDPGSGNRALARRTMTIVSRYGIPAIVQWEVAAAMDPSWYARNHDKVFCLWPPQHPYRYLLFERWDPRYAISATVRAKVEWQARLPKRAELAEKILRRLRRSRPIEAPYFTTWLVKKETVALMRMKGFTRPIELAHRRQVARAALIVRKLLGEMPILLGDEPEAYDARSLQKWTRSAWAYARYEAMARLHHLFFRYVY